LPKLFAILLSVFVPLRTYAQTVQIGTDSLFNQQVRVLDSAAAQASKSYFQLHHKYDSVKRNYDLLILAYKTDSLSRISGPSNQFLQKCDSIERLKQATMLSIKNKFDSLNAKLIGKIEKMNIPPELTAKAEEYTTAMNKLDLSLPSSSLQLRSLKIDTYFPPSLPNLSNSLSGELPNLSAANIPRADDISKATLQLQGLPQSVPKDIPTMDQLGKIAETQATQIKEVSAVQDQLGGLPTTPIPSEEQAKQELLNQAKEAVTDHFAGKEQELKSAMDQISKYKKKYHNVNNLEQLAQLIKKRPNEMRGKPLIERIIPGLAFQLQKRDDLLFVDFNPYFGYRFTGRLTAGAGWNQRVAYNLNENTFNNDTRILVLACIVSTNSGEDSHRG
jgi:hypothetical protein